MKILIIRFSSIGDIILTTPVVRCLKKRYADAEIHYLTKSAYVSLLEANPYIDRVIPLGDSMGALLTLIRKERYDHVIDLHRNLRTFRMKLGLFRRFHTFNKLNVRKWLLVNFRIDLLPRVHIVERYLDAVRFLGVKYDGQGLDHFIPAETRIPEDVAAAVRQPYLVLVIGAKQFTKRVPTDKVVSICQALNRPVCLLGGPEDREKGEEIKSQCSGQVFNACGLLSLNESALLLRDAQVAVTADTGMMHIAAALKKPIVSIWGNTIPAFGMYPCLPEGMEAHSQILEVNGLPCRPCTKLGFSKCPKGHFKCMADIPVDQVLQFITFAENSVR